MRRAPAWLRGIRGCSQRRRMFRWLNEFTRWSRAMILLRRGDWGGAEGMRRWKSEAVECEVWNEMVMGSVCGVGEMYYLHQGVSYGVGRPDWRYCWHGFICILLTYTYMKITGIPFLHSESPRSLTHMGTPYKHLSTILPFRPCFNKQMFQTQHKTNLVVIET